jgi:hypothetical protein
MEAVSEMGHTMCCPLAYVLLWLLIVSLSLSLSLSLFLLYFLEWNDSSQGGIYSRETTGLCRCPLHQAMTTYPRYLLWSFSILARYFPCGHI